MAEGIYQDACGYLATVTESKLRKDLRFPPGTPIPFMEKWRIRIRADLAEDAAQRDPETPTPTRGTFAADLARYLPQIKGRVSYKADRSHLQAWLPQLGPRLRSAITPAHVRRAMAAWREAGKSARTIRHRIRVLRELYATLDGRHAAPPLAGVKLPKIAEPNPTPVSLKLIQTVAASLKRGLVRRRRCGPKRTFADVHCAEPEKTYARFLVRATTGQRPAQIMRAKPEDLDLTRGIWFVRPAKGGRAIPLPLTAEMVEAWAVFVTAKAWGPFDTRSFSQTIRRHGWPKGIRPYALRHTFAIDHLLGGTDLGDLQGLLGHRQIETTRHFYAPVLLARLKKVGANRTLKLVDAKAE